MKLIVISHPIKVTNEIGIINSLFENGMEIFHIHKPTFSEKEIKNYFQQFPKKYQGKIFLHPDFFKFHSLKELEDCKEKYDYSFLSPIFDSISKKNHKSKFSHISHKFSQIKSELISAICGKNVIALGGIDEDKIEICRELDFAGVAILGAIWNSENPVEKFKRIKEKCEKKDLVF